MKAAFAGLLCAVLWLPTIAAQRPNVQRPNVQRPNVQRPNVQRPNILIITADNLGYGDLPCLQPRAQRF